MMRDARAIVIASKLSSRPIRFAAAAAAAAIAADTI
jgi:hypothetical protein